MLEQADSIAPVRIVVVGGHRQAQSRHGGIKLAVGAVMESAVIVPPVMWLQL